MIGLYYCGADNELILNNFLHTNESDGKYRLIVRTPIIPGINDSEKELTKMGEFCAKLKKLSHIQLLPYHRLGSDTYNKLGRVYKLADLQAPSAEHMERCREIVRRSSGCKVI